MRLRSEILNFGVAAVVGLALAGCGGKPSPGPSADSGKAKTTGGKVVIALLPKLINIDYFDACKRGASKAANELGATLIFDGPTEASGSEQNKFIDTWV